MDTVGERLKAARAARGWTQAHLGLAADLSTGTVGNIEAGIRQAKGSLPLLAKALGISHNWLAYGEGDMAESQTSTPLMSGAALEIAALYDMIPMSSKIVRARYRSR